MYRRSLLGVSADRAGKGIATEEWPSTECSEVQGTGTDAREAQKGHPGRQEEKPRGGDDTLWAPCRSDPQFLTGVGLSLAGLLTWPPGDKVRTALF